MSVYLSQCYRYLFLTQLIKIAITYTLLNQLEDNVVTDIRTEEKHGYTALQVGCTVKKEKHTTKPLLEHFKKLGVGLRQKLFEFRVTKDALLPIGTELTASHFVEGQFVDVTAPS